MKAPVPVYRPILKHALATAWTHRELWPIAAVAGLAGTGAVVNDVLNQAKLAAAIPTSNFSRAFGNLHILGVYRDSLIHATAGQITLGTVVIFLLGILLVAFIAACQQTILGVAHGALKSREHLPFRDIWRRFRHPNLLRFLSLDLFLKLVVANLTIVVTLLLAQLNMGYILSDAVFGAIFSAAALWLALLANVLVMLALIGITRKNLPLAEAAVYAWRLYRRNQLICIEMSVLLFAVNFALSAAYDGTMVVLGVPAVFGFIGALQSGSLAVYVLVITLTALVVVAVTLAFAGFATTFTYAAWTALAEKLDKKTFTPRVVAHAKHLLGQWR